MQISTTQPIQQQKQVVQATAEQIRLAQMIYDKNDADFEDKVKQLMEVTGKNQDECIVALHDCNGDVNRAINILLEGSSDTVRFYLSIKPLLFLVVAIYFEKMIGKVIFKKLIFHVSTEIPLEEMGTRAASLSCA
uniref:UBA domain-containing protein n=1 Tax=Anser cygnoides TaxID=8845 RepID=A0A8B9EJZ0_ANSCY